MDEQAFNEQIGKLEAYFGKDVRGSKKAPGAGKQYWDEVKDLPQDAFADICRAYMKQHAPTPGNFPTIQALEDAFRGPNGWLDRHPERKAKPIREFCPYCESNAPGVIEVMIPLEKPIYPIESMNFRNTLVRCGHCRNHEERNPTWPRLRRDEILARGWTIVTPEHHVIDEEDRWRKTRKPSPDRSPGMRSIQDSLPMGDRDDIPF